MSIFKPPKQHYRWFSLNVLNLSIRFNKEGRNSSKNKVFYERKADGKLPLAQKPNISHKKLRLHSVNYWKKLQVKTFWWVIYVSYEGGCFAGYLFYHLYFFDLFPLILATWVHFVTFSKRNKLLLSDGVWLTVCKRDPNLAKHKTQLAKFTNVLW